jgi:Fic family protein
VSYYFSLTAPILKYIQAIERVRERLKHTVLPPMVAEQLRSQAQVRSTHYSTRIEGNRLTLRETEEVVHRGKLFPGRERDVAEVDRYYQALQRMEEWVERDFEITEQRIRKLHGLIFRGGRARATPYRDGQNVIRDGAGEIAYMPPEAEDIPGLMKESVGWINSNQNEWPVPVVAGIAHYQFETIHPFFDGNGRTGRMLTTWILYRGGYDLGKFYALEEFYADGLEGYYDALSRHPHHNYYFGHQEADIAPWLEYFLNGVQVVFERVAEEVERQAADKPVHEEHQLLATLDHRARQVLTLFAKSKFIRTEQVAKLLSISRRQARDVISGWVGEGWLVIADPSRRGRKYGLANGYKKLVG